MRHVIPTRTALFVSLLSAATISACGGDPVGLEGDPLSEAELQAVLTALSSAFSSLGAAPAMASEGPQRVPVPVDQSFDTSVPCAQGGAIAASGSVTGTVDDETFASDARFELTFDPVGCVVNTEASSITVDGDPDVVVVMNTLFTDSSISMSGTQRGGIRYTVDDGRSGACWMDIAFSVTVDQSAPDAAEQSVTGSVCGIPASQFQTFGSG